MSYIILISLTLFGCINALTEEEIKAEMTKHVIKCNKNMGVDVSELLKLQRYITPTNKQTKCLLACAYKAAEVLTKDGLYDINHAYKVAEQMKNGDEKRLINAKKMADVCARVNNVKVSDGENGCDRAALIFKCTADNAPKFGFKL